MLQGGCHSLCPGLAELAHTTARRHRQSDAAPSPGSPHCRGLRAETCCATHPHRCPAPHLMLGAAQHRIVFMVPLQPSVLARLPHAPSAHAGRSGRGTAGSQCGAQAGCELAAAAGSMPGQCLHPGPRTKLCAPGQPHGGPAAGELFANRFVPAPCPAAQPPASFAGICFRSTWDSSRQFFPAKRWGRSQLPALSGPKPPKQPQSRHLDTQTRLHWPQAETRQLIPAEIG